MLSVRGPDDLQGESPRGRKSCSGKAGDWGANEGRGVLTAPRGRLPPGRSARSPGQSERQEDPSVAMSGGDLWAGCLMCLFLSAAFREVI